MHLFNINAVANKLKQRQMFALEKVAYFIGMVSLIAVRIGVFNLLPTLYSFTFSLIKTRLEWEARAANLTIDVPTGTPLWFAASLVIIIALGIFGCYTANRSGDNKQFIERFVCLSWPAMLRIMALSTILFGVIMLFGWNLFSKELALLAAKKQKGIPFIGFFVKTFKQLNVLKTIGDNLTKLARAKVLFSHVSQFSLHMYNFCHAFALLGTVWYFRSIRKRLSFIAHK